MLNLDTRVIETPKKLFIGYSAGRKFAEIVPQSKAFILYLNLSMEAFVSVGNSRFSPPEAAKKAAEALHMEDVSKLGRWRLATCESRLPTKNRHC